MAFTTWRIVRDYVGGWFLAPLCLLLLSPIAGVETPAYATAIEMMWYNTISQPVGSGAPPFTSNLDGVPAASFTGSDSDRHGSASISGSVDLRTGELRAFASVAGPVAAFATVSMNEVLTFSWADPTRLDPITVSATFSLDSAFFGSSATRDRTGMFSYGFGDLVGAHSLSVCDICSLNVSATRTIQLTPSVLYPLQMGLYIGAGSLGPGTATFDAGHTAGFSFELPQGATFVSNSGYFLTGAPAAVPEPGTVWLLGIGLIGMAALTHFTKWKKCGAAETL